MLKIVENNAESFQRWETRIIYFLCFFSICSSILPSGFNWNATYGDLEALSQGTIGAQLQWGAIFLTTAYFFARHKKLFVNNFKNINVFLVFICAYCFLSIFWSPQPVSTLKKSIQFSGVISMMLVFYISIGKNNIENIPFAIMYTLTFIELVSVFFVFAFPSTGIDSYFVGAWQGILNGKNSFGSLGSFTFIFWVYAFHTKKIATYVCIFGMALSFLCTLKSTSSTSLTVLFVGAVAFLIFKKQHILSNLWLQRIAVSLAIVILVLFHFFYIFETRFPSSNEVLGPFTSLFGKSADLTGRSEIWEALIPIIKDHWLFGVGFSGFWFGPGSAAQPVLDKLTWIPFQAHNGYLDLINELGFVGLVIFIGLIISSIKKLILIMKFDRLSAALYSSIIVSVLLSNQSETSLFKTIDFQFIIFLYACVFLSCYSKRESISF